MWASRDCSIFSTPPRKLGGHTCARMSIYSPASIFLEVCVFPTSYVSQVEVKYENVLPEPKKQTFSKTFSTDLVYIHTYIYVCVCVCFSVYMFIAKLKFSLLFPFVAEQKEKKINKLWLFVRRWAP